MRPRDLLCPKPGGLYCAPGDFYIDPVRPVPRALITHGHSDHARSGHGSVLATRQTLDIMGLRYGEDFAGSTQEAVLGETVDINGVSRHLPSGRPCARLGADLQSSTTACASSPRATTSASPTPPACPSSLFRCDVFITEATFGLPVFRHPPDTHEIAKLIKSTEQFPERAHLVGAYALGKAQRVIRLIRDSGYGKPIYIHGAMATLCEYYQSEGIDLGDLRPATVEGGSKARFRRRDRRRPAVSLRRPLGAALSRSDLLFRVGLDAHPPARQAGRRRAAADHLRPFRLGRAFRRPSSRPARAKSG